MATRLQSTTCFLRNNVSCSFISTMICLIFGFLASVAMATVEEPLPIGLGVLAPSYSQHVGPDGAVKVDFNQAKNAYSYTVSNVENPTGAIKQQTAVGKDALGGHSIRHSAQATHIDPLSGQTAVKHDEHAFHINPYFGHAAVHTNNAAGSLNPALGHAAFQQQTHEAQIAPGHRSVADAANTAAVSPFGNAASQAVQTSRADVVPGGVAHAAHAAHRSHSNGAGIGGVTHSAVTNRQGFDGHGYGNLNYNTQAASHAYDPYGHGSVNEAGYNLNTAYDARVGLGASNEVSYNRHAAHDPYGNYGAVTNARHAAQGGHLVPTYSTLYSYKQPAAVVYGPPAYVPSGAVHAGAVHAVAVQPAPYYHI